MKVTASRFNCCATTKRSQGEGGPSTLSSRMRVLSLQKRLTFVFCIPQLISPPIAKLKNKLHASCQLQEREAWLPLFPVKYVKTFLTRLGFQLFLFARPYNPYFIWLFIVSLFEVGSSLHKSIGTLTTHGSIWPKRYACEIWQVLMEGKGDPNNPLARLQQNQDRQKQNEMDVYM